MGGNGRAREGERERERERERVLKSVAFVCKMISKNHKNVYILPLKKPGLRHLLRLSKKVEHTLQEEIILNEVGAGGSPPIKGTPITGQASM